MKTYHHTSYSDSLAQKKRRRFFIRLSILMSVFVFLSGFAVYSIFYSGWMDINSISVTGLKTVSEDQILPAVQSITEREGIRLLKLKYQKNTFFFNPQLVKDDILAQFPIIKDVKITKKYPHNLSIEITERTPVGTWCFLEDCSYFDEDGVLWGKAIRSSGSLLLTVEDNRITTESPKKVDKVFLENIKSAISGLESLGVKTVKAVIKSDTINDFFIHTVREYYIIFNTETPVTKQLDVLKIFLNEKGQDFKAEYIDLRIDGRVYYR